MIAKSLVLLKSLITFITAPVILDEEVAKRNDIGFPYQKPPRSAEFNKRFDHLKKQRSDSSLEKAARTTKCKLQLNICDIFLLINFATSSTNKFR